MTSTLAPFGFRAVRSGGARTNSRGLNRYRINPAGYAGQIFSGDPVKTGVTGFVTQASATTDYILGVFMGCIYNDPVTKRPTWSMYYPANTSVGTDPFGIVALVDDDVGTNFIIQADASVTVGDVGLNFDVTVSAGSTYTGNSGFALKAASRKVTTGLMRVVDIYETPDNSFGGGTGDQFPVVEVRLVQTQNSTASVTA